MSAEEKARRKKAATKAAATRKRKANPKKKVKRNTKKVVFRASTLGGKYKIVATGENGVYDATWFTSGKPSGRATGYSLEQMKKRLREDIATAKKWDNINYKVSLDLLDIQKNPKKKATPKKASIRITKLKAGGYSISGKDKTGKPIKMRSEKKSTANAVKRLVVDKGYTVAQLRKLEKSAKALRPYVKNPGKVWFPAKPPKATKVRKKTPVQLRKKKKPAAAKKNPTKKRSYTKVTKIFKALVTRIGKKTPKAKDALKKVGLVVQKGIHDTPRHYGIYIPSKNLVGVAPEITDCSDSVIRGVLLHELGHALIDQGLYAKAKKRGYYATERRADVVAKAASGLTVYYGKDHIQRAGAGASGLKVRPKSLR
jgi:hypothetical protein